MSELADTIKSRGFWRVTVRPSRFDPNHIDDYNRLFAVVRDSAVELRGWDCPHIDTQNPPRRENAWVGQETGWEHYRELWRLYRSGQFLFLGGYEEDWRDHSGFTLASSTEMGVRTFTLDPRRDLLPHRVF